VELEFFLVSADGNIRHSIVNFSGSSTRILDLLNDRYPESAPWKLILEREEIKIKNVYLEMFI
jgi:hypothetical protein